MGSARPLVGPVRRQPARRVGHHDRVRERHGRCDRHRLPAARRPRRTFRLGLRLHRRFAASRTTAAGATPTRPIRATGSRAPRTRAATSQGCGTQEQLLARHARLGHDRRQRPNNALGVAGINWVSQDAAGAGARQVRRLHERHRRRDPLGRRACPSPASPRNPTPDEVVNLSLGGSGACGVDLPERDQRRASAAGTVVVVAAGNSNAERVGLLAGELQQRDHRRGDRPHGQPCLLLELRRVGRDRRARRRRACSARRSSRRSTPARRRLSRAPDIRTRTTRARAWRRRTSSASSR